VGRAPSPGRQALVASHDGSAGDQLDDQAEGLQDAASSLDRRQRHPEVGDQAGVGGSAVTAGVEVGVGGHAAGDGEGGVGFDVMGAADVAVLGEGVADLRFDPVGGSPPGREGGGRAGNRADAGGHPPGGNRGWGRG
jgi:hypothetical protein